MNLYVVMSNQGIHHDCITVCLKKEQAESFLSRNKVNKGYIKSVEVVGDYAYPKDVYEANAYLGEWKVHTFIGLYADPADAEAAAGENGTVLPRSVERD